MPSLRVVTLNIGSVLEPRWDERQHEIATWLVELDADVVCLPEASQSPTRPNRGGDIARLVAEAGGPDYQWAFGGFEPTSPVFTGIGEAGLEFGSAILSRWPIDDTSLHLLPIRDDLPGARGVGWELFHARTLGLDVFSTHLAAAPHEGLHRRAQVIEIDRIVKEVRGGLDDLWSATRASMPPILCGDFNAEPHADEIRWLCGLTAFGDSTTFWQDAWHTAGDGGPGLTQDWRDNEIGRSLNVHRKRIDYVFVGDPFLRRDGGGRVLHCEVVCDEPKTGVVCSDHRGVMADIEWPDRPV